MSSKPKIPVSGPERPQLEGWLDAQRSLVRMKCEGLSDEDGHRALLSTSPLMTVAGIVSHLRWVEYSWFHLDMVGVPDEGQTPWRKGEHPDAEMIVDGVPLSRLLDDYEAECERSREIAARYDLDDLETNPGGAKVVSLRYILIHMIEETARHLGHLDIIAELLDGRTGYVTPDER